MRKFACPINLFYLGIGALTKLTKIKSMLHQEFTGRRALHYILNNYYRKLGKLFSVMKMNGRLQSLGLKQSPMLSQQKGMV